MDLILLEIDDPYGLDFVKLLLLFLDLGFGLEILMLSIYRIIDRGNSLSLYEMSDFFDAIDEM